MFYFISYFGVINKFFCFEDQLVLTKTKQNNSDYRFCFSLRQWKAGISWSSWWFCSFQIIILIVVAQLIFSWKARIWLAASRGSALQHQEEPFAEQWFELWFLVLLFPRISQALSRLCVRFLPACSGLGWDHFHPVIQEELLYVK